jgi:hypothetical protein
MHSRLLALIIDADLGYAQSIQSLLTAQSGLDHPNLWPVLGYTSKHGLPAIVTPYCSLGDVVQYTHRCPQTQQSRLKLVSVRAVDQPGFAEALADFRYCSSHKLLAP